MSLAEMSMGHGQRKGRVAPATGLPDIGQKGDSRASVIQACLERGVVINADTVTQIRNGTTSGLNIVRAISATEIAREGRAPDKDIFFAEYGALGIVKRGKRTDDRSRAFRSRGLRMRLASELGLSEDILGGLLRALRIDLFYTPTDQAGAAFRDNFECAVEAYLKDLGKYINSQKAEEIGRRWDRAKTHRNFYRMLLHQPGTIISTWTPYEVEPIWTLATNRLNHHSPITPFDRMVLNGINGDRSDHAIVRKITADLKTATPRQIVNYHRALLMGRIKIKPQGTD